MTFDEFKEKIIPYMKKGYIAMDKNGSWYYYTGNKPYYLEDGNTWMQNAPNYFISLRCFNIDKVPNWKNSLFRIY